MLGFENHTVNELANMVKKNIGDDVLIETQPTNDMGSYHISSKKIKDETGFTTKFSIEDAINDL